MSRSDAENHFTVISRSVKVSPIKLDRFMNLKEICIPIQREMDQLELVLSEHLQSPIPFVQGVVDYVIRNGGKRLRPLLAILSSKLCGYQGDAGIRLGAAVEFMHTATLLHDDVIDNASLRRGRFSSNKKWGNHVSVLVGDFFYCRAMDILVRHGDLRVLQVMTDAMTTTTEGEIFEITKSNDLGTTEADYLQIITNKTAVLIAATCQIGALLGHVSEELEHALKRFGLNLGIAFQLIDDVLDYSSVEEEFGKANGTDLKEGKLTLPLIYALKKSNDEEGRFIKNAVIADETNPETFNQILEIIGKYNGLRETASLARSFIEKAKEQLQAFKPSLEKDTLMTIADYVICRKN